MRIVIIDENPSMTEMIGMLLKTQGHTVLTAFSGRSGLALALAAEPDLVIVDLDLSDMSALDVIRYLKFDNDDNECTLVALAEHQQPTIVRDAVDAGACHIFAKNSDVSGLLSLTNIP